MLLHPTVTSKNQDALDLGPYKQVTQVAETDVL